MVNYCSSELKLLCLAGIQLNIICKIDSRQKKNTLSAPRFSADAYTYVLIADFTHSAFG